MALKSYLVRKLPTNNKIKKYVHCFAKKNELFVGVHVTFKRGIRSQFVI